MNRFVLGTTLAGLALSISQGAGAGIIWSEGVDGDLTGDRTNPSALAVLPGNNIVTGSVGAGDRDYLRFTVPAGGQLTGVVLAAIQSTSALSFIGVEAGPQVTVDPLNPAPGPLHGYAHFAPANLGQDILPAIGTGAGSIGFAPPLGPGTYSFWIQETSPTIVVSYSFNFQTTPSQGIAGPLGAIGLAAMRRRR